MLAAVTLLAVVSVLACGELAVWWLVATYRPGFQWITTPADTAPPIDREMVRKHIDRGFDSELGWVRKPGTTGIEQTESGPKTYVIDTQGCRTNPGCENSPPVAAVFGDSFAFCRLVADDETWPYYLSRATGTNVLNFGVGNYGLDQAILRLERELPSLDSQVILMAVVPETMARIHSYWKHYYEYGNTLAFKPRFRADAEGLQHIQPAVTSENDYYSYKDRLAKIQGLDHFYERKFLRDVLAFPYLPKLVRRIRRHLPIFWHLAAGSVTGQRDRGYRRAFNVVLRQNGELATRMYGDPAACDLFRRLAERFANLCAGAGRDCALIILPQPYDVEAPGVLTARRDTFFEGLQDIVPVIDLAGWFAGNDRWPGLFVSGDLGPHLNAKGNRAVAERLLQTLENLDLDMTPERLESHAAENRCRDLA